MTELPKVCQFADRTRLRRDALNGLGFWYDDETHGARFLVFGNVELEWVTKQSVQWAAANVHRTLGM